MHAYLATEPAQQRPDTRPYAVQGRGRARLEARHKQAKQHSLDAWIIMRDTLRVAGQVAALPGEPSTGSSLITALALLLLATMCSQQHRGSPLAHSPSGAQ